MRILKLFVGGVLLAIVAAMMNVMAVMAIDNAGIGGRPANPRSDNPRSQSIFLYELKPGEKTEDAVQVVNNTDKQKTLLVYAVDSQVSSDGAFACAQKADTAVNVGTWISLAKDQVTLKPGTSENVSFTIEAPITASAGEQNGCIVIQDSEQSSSSQGNGVVLSFRSAIRVAVTVPGAITKQLDFSGPVGIKLDKDKIFLAVGLKNNGNVSLDSAVKAQIKSIFGTTVGSAGGTFPVLAHSQAVFNLEVKKPFWGGWYAVKAAATYGSDTDKSIGESGNETTIDYPTKLIFVVPETKALVIELLGLLLAIGTLGLILARKQRMKTIKSKSKTYTVKKGDTLHTISSDCGTSWKVIARLNRLKAPYHVQPGQQLKIPSKLSDAAHEKSKLPD